jgi:hypothetical protein
MILCVYKRVNNTMSYKLIPPFSKYVMFDRKKFVIALKGISKYIRITKLNYIWYSKYPMGQDGE